MTSNVGLFISTLIKKEKYRFNYGRKWHVDRMRESTIKLPVKIDGTPDWEFMENYIKSLPYSSQLDK
jgi:predicted nucleotidyltransferase